jgi:hypothetical protein
MAKVKLRRSKLFDGTANLKGEKLFNKFLNETLNNTTEVEIEVFNDKIDDPNQLMLNKITKDDIPKINFFTLQNTLISHACRLSGHSVKNNTIKSMTPAPVTLSKSLYNRIYPPFNHFITKKADGIRCYVYMCDNGYIILTSKSAQYSGDPDVNIRCIVDAELVGNKILVFDIVYVESMSSNMTYKERVGIIGDVLIKYQDMFKDHELTTKPILEVTKDTIDRVFKDIKTAGDGDFEDDGYMLVQGNQSYFKTNAYKIKCDMNTIDFLVAEIDDDYYLFCGISRKMMNKLVIQRAPIYYKIFNNVINDYNPIQFSPFDNPDAYHYKPTDKDKIVIKKHLQPLDGMKVKGTFIELLPKFKDGSYTWEFIGVREDRVNEKNYYGNNYRTAEINWRVSQDPMCVEEMSKPVTTYFEHSKSNIYKMQVSYLSICKTMILKEIRDIAPNRKILDTASGKGQDLYRIISLGFSYGIFTDIDAIALSELATRRFESISKQSNVKNDFGMAIQLADMSDPVEVNKLKFDKHLINGKPGSVICNLALHYFVHDKKSTNNFLSFLHYVLDGGGVFAFTCFDGAEVFDLLAENNGTWVDQQMVNGTPFEKYRIEAKYTSKTFTGINQKIAVKLPMSDTLKVENLVDIGAFVEAASNFGFKLRKMGSMMDFYDTMCKDRKNAKLCKALNESDKDYADLYSYVILVRES